MSQTEIEIREKAKEVLQKVADSFQYSTRLVSEKTGFEQDFLCYFPSKKYGTQQIMQSKHIYDGTLKSPEELTNDFIDNAFIGSMIDGKRLQELKGTFWGRLKFLFFK